MTGDPVFPDIGCSGECGFERRGAGWTCVSGEACGRHIGPDDDAHGKLERYHLAMIAASSSSLRLQTVLQGIDFTGTRFAEWEFGWRVSVADGGFHIECSFERPDVAAEGGLAVGFGRKWFVGHDDSAESMVFTAWLAVRQIVEHELHESFTVTVAGERVVLLDPHKRLQDLAVGSRRVTTPIEQLRAAIEPHLPAPPDPNPELAATRSPAEPRCSRCGRPPTAIPEYVAAVLDEIDPAPEDDADTESEYGQRAHAWVEELGDRWVVARTNTDGELDRYQLERAGGFAEQPDDRARLQAVCDEYNAEHDSHADPDRVRDMAREDGTYNPETGGFYCSACYVAVGQPVGIAP